MRIRKGIMAVIYKKKGDYYYFAVFNRILHWKGWEIVKGGLNEGENYEECVKREIMEETGIKNILNLEKLEGIQSWTYMQNGERIKTEFIPFLVEVPSDAKIDVSKNPVHEHSQGFFLNFRDSYSILKYSNQKELLKQAYELLTNKRK